MSFAHSRMMSQCIDTLATFLWLSFMIINLYFTELEHIFLLSNTVNSQYYVLFELIPSPPPSSYVGNFPLFLMPHGEHFLLVNFCHEHFSNCVHTECYTKPLSYHNQPTTTLPTLSLRMHGDSWRGSCDGFNRDIIIITHLTGALSWSGQDNTVDTTKSEMKIVLMDCMCRILLDIA